MQGGPLQGGPKQGFLGLAMRGMARRGPAKHGNVSPLSIAVRAQACPGRAMHPFHGFQRLADRCEARQSEAIQSKVFNKLQKGRYPHTHATSY
jgi:hypothetical protein